MVFVVDDEINVAKTTSLILRAVGFQVTTFYDGSEVLRHAPEWSPDVVVTDFAMPKVDGLALSAWPEEHYPQCKIVMISGHTATVPADRLDRGPHFTVLTKPVHPQELIAVVKGEPR